MGSGQETADAAASGDTKGRAASEGGGAKGEVEREWPVFGSDGVGGRFGAF